MAKKIYVRNNDNTEWVPLATSIPNASAYATYEYVDNELGNIDLISTINTASAAAVTYLVDSAPETLNTLNELSAALNDDANFASTITTALGNKLDISSASSTYLTQINASTIYATKTELNNIDALPSQSGNTGKFLQTDGTDVSWQNVDLSSKQDYSVVLDTLGSSYISLGEGSGFLKYTRGFLGSSPTWSLDTTTYLTQTSASSTYALKVEPRPNFLVYFSGGNGTVSNGATLSYNSELYDDLNNVLDGIFTVPSGHAGTYSFVVNANCYNIGSGNWRVNIETTGSNPVTFAGGFSPALGGSDTFANAHLIIKLAEGDTVRVKWVVPATGLYSAGINYNSFSGIKIF
jgi:hypothetical protein